MTESMASEPAEPTTRQELAEQVARELGELLGSDTDAFECEHFAQVLAVKGLLADPAQTTELERLRARVEELTDFAGEQANARRESDRVRNIAAREAADLRDERDTARTQLAEKTEYAGEKAREGDVMSLEIDELTADLEQARAQRNEAMETAGQLRDEVREHQVAAANLYGRVFVALGLSITEPWAGLAEAAAKVRAERDERQARIEAATAELKKWDALATRESEWMPCRAALAALVGDQGKHLAENQAESGGLKALTSGNSWANRDLDLSGAALRAVEEADDAAGDAP